MSDDNKQQSVELTEDDGLDIGYSGEMPENTDAEAEPEVKEDESVSDLDDDSEDDDQQQPDDDQDNPDKDPADQQKPEQKAPAQADPLSLEVRNYVEGRFRNFQGELNKALKELKENVTPADKAAADAAAKQQGADIPTNTEIAAALSSGEKFKQLEQDFPEWADALKESAGFQAAFVEKQILEKGGFAKADDITKASEDTKAEIIGAVHDNWEEDVNTPEFSEWFAQQDEATQSLASSDRPRDAIRLLNKFHGRENSPPQGNNQQPPASDKPQKPDPKTRLAAAVQPDTSGNKAPARVMTEDDALEYGFKRA